MTYYAKYKKRPCPGCGNVAKRPPQTLCKNCARQLEIGKRREKEIEGWKEGSETIRIALDTRFHYGSGAHVSFLSIKDWDVLDALVRLGRLDDAYKSGGAYTEARLIHYERGHPGGYGHRPHCNVFATREQADDIELVLDYIKEAIIKAYEDGKREGSSLLRLLANAGMKELNQITTGVK